MYSFKHLFNIFTVVNNNSEVHDRVCKAEDQIKEIFEAIQKLKDEDKNLRNHINTEMRLTREEIRNNKEE